MHKPKRKHKLFQITFLSQKQSQITKALLPDKLENYKEKRAIYYAKGEKNNNNKKEKENKPTMDVQLDEDAWDHNHVYASSMKVCRTSSI